VIIVFVNSTNDRYFELQYRKRDKKGIGIILREVLWFS